MGSGIKTLVSIMELTNAGALEPGASICDIGVTQLFGPSADEGARSFLSFYAGRTAKAERPDSLSETTYMKLGDGGYLGDLLILAGFEYTALDIFKGTNTILFDLNVHAPGDKLRGRFDLVMNFGTTEHVFNQLRAFQTIHDLASPAGVVYHDLPVAGFFNHALFRYDPLFFKLLAEANGYEVIKLQLSTAPRAPRMESDRAPIQYGPETMDDVGMEAIYIKTGDTPFQIPLEASTALSLDPDFYSIDTDDYVAMPAGYSVSYNKTHGSFATGLRRAFGLIRDKCLMLWRKRL